jgi:NAD(P)-dependent dehydrogenase (short-subunit alcohol dehydrogenase family)
MAPVHFNVGASGGLGAALCRQLRASGARLVLAARRAGPLEELAAELDATPVTLDATSVEEVDRAVQEAAERHGRLDGVVNCAGSLLLAPAHRTSAEQWREVLAANLDTAFATLRAGARAMSAEGGSIVLVSSAAARVSTYTV